MKASLAIALAVAVCGQVLYQLMQKGVSHGAHPVLSLLSFYALAMVMSLPLFLLFPLDGSLREAWGQMNWAVVGVALSIVLIELGFLLAYRGGGSLQSSYVTSAAFTTGALMLAGTLLYGEAISLSKLAGLALALTGIWLLSRPTP
jgi:drug/metabolite transporter (DMT)-like permease